VSTGIAGKEADIIINGTLLSYAESMTLRVALGAFVTDLIMNGLGKDETGKSICTNYLRHSKSIINLIHK
jgi:hypothetical protein